MKVHTHLRNHGPVELRKELARLEALKSPSAGDQGKAAVIREELEGRANGTHAMSMSGFKRRMGELLCS